jgi:hypothetical protein
MSPALVVPPERRDVLRQALADAVYYRDPPAQCRACEALDRLCDQCAAGLARARAYLALGRELGIDGPPQPPPARTVGPGDSTA